MYVPSVCEDHVGRVTLSVHAATVFPVVALCVVARLKTATCHADPVQYLLSELRCRVKVVLLAFRPVPPLLSAALPLKVAGTVAVRKALPFAGVVTDAVVGAVLSIVKVTAVLVPVLPTLSVAFACTVYVASA